MSIYKPGGFLIKPEKVLDLSLMMRDMKSTTKEEWVFGQNKTLEEMQTSFAVADSYHKMRDQVFDEYKMMFPPSISGIAQLGECFSDAWL